MQDLTYEQAVQQFCINIKWHYAQHITRPDASASYVSLKTLRNMRYKLTTDGIYTEIFDTVLKTLATKFEVDLKKQRMDSVHIRSNIRHLGRIGQFVKTIKNFLRNLKQQNRGLFDQLDSAFTKRYMDKKAKSIFSMVKPS